MPHPVDIHVGRRMRECRELRGMPQKVLAEELGLSFQQIQKYESGANRISASKMWQLCGILGVEPDYFFEGLSHRRRAAKPGARRKAAPETDPHHARQILDLNHNFQKIADPVVRRNLIQLVKTLA